MGSTVDNNGYEDVQSGKGKKPMSQENSEMEEESADEAEEDDGEKEDAPSPPGPAEKIIIVLVVLALITCSTGLVIWGTIVVFDKDFGSGRK